MASIKPDRPNILFIFPDQWRGDAMSYFGHPVAQTPFVDQLANRGVAFNRAYANCPLCLPVRNCLVTGQTPSTVGRMAYQDEIPWNYHPTFMHLLRDSGYQTMLSGKTHFFPPRNHLGFEQMALYDNQRHHWPGFESDYDRWLREKTNGQIEDTAQHLQSNGMMVHPWTHDESLHANSWTVTEACNMLERRDPMRPFFLQLSFHRPHPPIDPPIEYFQRFADVQLPDPPVGDWAEWAGDRSWAIDPTKGQMDPVLFDRSRRAYYAQLAHLDYQVGRIIRWLQLRRMVNDTIIVFASDHGELLGDHAMFRKSSAMEGSLRVPLIVQMHRDFNGTRGTVCDAPVTLIDLMPTFLEMAGLSIPDSVEATSLMPLINEPHEAPRQDHVHAECSSSPIGGWQCVTNGKRKLVWFTVTGLELFFDLEQDPQEKHNLANDPARKEEVAQWRQRLIDQLKHRTEDGLTDGQRLIPGKQLPKVRDWVLEEAGLK